MSPLHSSKDAPAFLEETVAVIVAFLSRLVGAFVVLLIGWVPSVAAAKEVQTMKQMELTFVNESVASV